VSNREGVDDVVLPLLSGPGFRAAYAESLFVVDKRARNPPGGGFGFVASSPN